MEQMETNPDLRKEETLDPEDWSETRELSHRMVDDAVAYLRAHASPHLRESEGLGEDVVFV
jgi:hypothetical protein